LEKQDYIRVKNIVINDLHISRDDILDMMNKHVEKVLRGEIENLLRSDFFTRLLDITLFRIMKDGIENESYWCKPTTLQDYIKQEVHRAVRERIMTKYEIEIKERE
jgi:hypothetical protein